MYRRSSSVTGLGAGLIDGHLIAATRLILAISGALIVDYASMPNFNSAATRMVLVLYIAYSACLYLFAARKNRFQQSISKWAYWTDIGWFALLLSLSGGANSIFFFGFLFAILVASFERGFASGLLATLVSASLFISVSLVTAANAPRFELYRFLVRLVYLVVLGYLMAHWGGLKTKLNRQMSLLKKISTVSPARLSVKHLIAGTLEQLREFCDADSCLLILSDPEMSGYSLHRVKRNNSTAATDAEPIPAEMVEVLLGLPPEQAVVSSEGLSGWQRLDYRYDVKKNEPVSKGREASKVLVSFLDAKSFITVPLNHHTHTVGRLYLTAQRRRAFYPSDVAFLIQLTEQLIPVIDNIRLVDRLASEAADEERQRIARDIHDSIIQPYIGLQMGLVGVRQRLSLETINMNGGDNRLVDTINDAAADTDRLIEMTAGAIEDLRGYVQGLQHADKSEGSLLPAVRRFAARFTQATHIAVQVRADTDIHVDHQLETEIFQMIVEGLSNIRRHTQSERAFIGLEDTDGCLTLRIENDVLQGSVPKPFSPRSISERAEALGGRAYVETFGDLGTSVIIELPHQSD
ncbi:MAG: histidine kinase [Blastocatellia bacterium]